MNYALSPTVHDAVREFMSTGSYSSADELMLDALSALRERQEDHAAMAASIAEMEAGLARPFDEVAEEIRVKHGFPADA
jgi:Arc/MetJ-type ribon-helix-helix transcriptional regulator